jgi:hypothetical protein
LKNTVFYHRSNILVLYIDPTGGFKVPVHKDITRSAFDRAFVNRGAGMSFMFKSDLVYGVSRADYFGFALDFHFDNRQNYNEVVSTWKTLNKNIQETVKDIGGYNNKLGGYDVTKLGVLLHNVQDFYAHSNYVELYIDYYKSNNEGKMPTSVPIYDDGIKDNDFNTILKDKLRTGDFNVKEFIVDETIKKKNMGSTSHQQMNKDEANTPAGKLAKEVAIEHSTKILNQVE